MDSTKEKQKISLIGRIFSLEAMIMVMGIASLVSGGISGNIMQIFWGVSIVCGAIALHFVRKKDWKKHWEEQEQMKQAYEDRAARERKEKEKQ